MNEPPFVLASQASKESFRKAVWDNLESKNLAAFPRPVHHRIPIFKTAGLACEKCAKLPQFMSAKTVKVNPDKPQETARFLALQAGKTVLVPTPRLRHGLFNQLCPPATADKHLLKRLATSEGVKNFSKEIGLDSQVTVDLIVIGSVAVDPKGHRIGKGEGYADLEYAMMRTMGIIHKLDEQFVKHEVSEFSMEWNPNVELSSACGCALSAQPNALDSSTFGFHSIENSDT